MQRDLHLANTLSDLPVVNLRELTGDLLPPGEATLDRGDVAFIPERAMGDGATGTATVTHITTGGRPREEAWQGAVLTVDRDRAGGYTVHSSLGDGVVPLEAGVAKTFGRNGTDPDSFQLGLHRAGTETSRGQWTFCALPGVGLFVIDGMAYVDTDGRVIDRRASVYGSFIHTGSKGDWGPAETKPAQTKLLPRYYVPEQSDVSPPAIDAKREAEKLARSDYVRTGKLADDGWYEVADLATIRSDPPVHAVARPEPGDAKDLGGLPGERQTLLGVLRIPGVGPIWIVDVRAAYQAGRLRKHTEMAQGVALVRPPVQGGEPQLIGFTQSAHSVSVPKNEHRMAAAIRPHPDESGGLVARAYTEDVGMTVFAEKHVPPSGVPDLRVWKLPFDSADGSDWRLIQKAVQSSGGSGAYVAPPRTTPGR